MPANETLVRSSDWSYFTAFAFYLVAFVVSIAYYSRRIVAAEAKSQAAERELVATGAGDGATTVSAASSVGPETKTSASVVKNQALTQKLGVVAEMPVYVGTAVHLASVLLRGLAVQRFLWGNLYEYISVSVLSAMVAGAGALHRETMRVFWPWTLAPILALMFYGGRKLYTETASIVPALQSIWFPIYVSIISIGCSIALISGMASILYMLRMYNYKGSEKGLLGKLVSSLPDAQKLDTIVCRTAIWPSPLFGLGIVLGAIWAEPAWGRFWGWNLKETTALITWIICAPYLYARTTSGWRSTKAAWINTFGFATMVFNLFLINMVVLSLHFYADLN